MSSDLGVEQGAERIDLGPTSGGARLGQRRDPCLMPGAQPLAIRIGDDTVPIGTDRRAGDMLVAVMTPAKRGGGTQEKGEG